MSATPAILKTYDGAVYSKESALAAGQAVTIELFDGKAFAWSVYPGAGATVTIEFSTSSRAMVQSGNGRFRAYGTLTAPGGDESLTPYTALRFTTAGGTAIVEVVQK